MTLLVEIIPAQYCRPEVPRSHYGTCAKLNSVRLANVTEFHLENAELEKVAEDPLSHLGAITTQGQPLCTRSAGPLPPTGSSECPKGAVLHAAPFNSAPSSLAAAENPSLLAH